MEQPQVIIGIGQPAAGKTTYLKQLAKELNAFYISPDDLREELLGDYRDFSQNDMIWDRLYQQVDQALAAGQDVVVDGAGINPKYRRMDIKRYRKHAQRIVAYVFETPLEVSLERNTARHKPIPDRDIRHKHGRMIKYPPSLDEGFDEIVVITHAEEPHS